MVHLCKERANMLYGSGLEKSDALYLCCEDCRKEIEKRECVGSVRKVGFVYTFNCDLDTLILRKILEAEKVPFESGAIDEDSVFFRRTKFYLHKHGILIDDKPDGTTVAQLSPRLLVTFGDKSAVTSLLNLKTDVLILTDEGEFYNYGHTRTVEKSLDIITNTIVEKLDSYAESIRGNEHDRIIIAFENIGRELGYVPKREYGKRGIRVDCVWYDREGKIRVAIEVETKGGWKKDIISTWELEPDLSIIVTYQKTESVSKALLDFTLMKYLPHRLLYINMETKNAFLFEKQQILRKYSLEQKEKAEPFKIKDI